MVAETRDRPAAVAVAAAVAAADTTTVDTTNMGTGIGMDTNVGTDMCTGGTRENTMGTPTHTTADVATNTNTGGRDAKMDRAVGTDTIATTGRKCRQMAMVAMLDESAETRARKQGGVPLVASVAHLRNHRRRSEHLRSTTRLRSTARLRTTRLGIRRRMVAARKA